MTEQYIKVEVPNGEIWQFPSDMPEEEINKVIADSFPPEPEEKGWLGIGKDIYKSGKNFLPEFWKALKQLPSEVEGVNLNAERIPKNLLAGLAKGGSGLLNTPANIRDYLERKDIVSKEAPSLRLPESILPKEYNYAKGVGLNDIKPGDALTQGLAASAPYVMAGELGPATGLARTAMRSAAQVPFAIGQNENPVHAAASVPGFEIPLRGAAAGYNAMRPANRLRGNLPVEELQANARAAEGTNTDLGSIIGSPTLKQIFENISTKWPGSGSDELLARMGGQVEERAQNLLNEHGEGLAPGDLNAQLKTTLENAYETQRQRKNTLYEPVNELSQAENFTLELPSFRQRTNQQLAQIEQSPLMQFDPDFRAAYNRLAGLAEGDEGNPTILDTNMVASKLHEEGTHLKNNKSASAHDRAIGNLYLDLARRAREDLRSEMHQRGSTELNQAYDAATENYRENFSQFLDQDIYRLAQPEVEAETIVNDIIKPGKKGDKYSRIEKIQNVLPEEQRNILGNAWLRNALNKEGTLNAKQFAKLIDDLGPRQFEALFPDPVYRQRLLDYGRLRGMNEKALSRMANPMTGQSLAAPGMMVGQITGLGNALATGNLPMAAAWGLGPQVGSRIMNRLLTDPAIRDYMVNNILENQLNPPRQGNQLMASLLAGQSNAKDPFLTTASGLEVRDE